jgi:hypothetical protein
MWKSFGPKRAPKKPPMSISAATSSCRPLSLPVWRTPLPRSRQAISGISCSSSSASISTIKKRRVRTSTVLGAWVHPCTGRREPRGPLAAIIQLRWSPPFVATNSPGILFPLTSFGASVRAQATGVVRNSHRAAGVRLEVRAHPLLRGLLRRETAAARANRMTLVAGAR